MEYTSVVVVRPCCSPADCELVAALCGSSFPEEVASQGLSVQQWSQIEADDLKATPSWWRQIGLACEGHKLLGVVVLTVESEAEEPMSWGEYSRRVGCGPTILSMMYDRVLDEALLEHECLIDFIAVSPEARGKGVGRKLMQWAEEAGAAILAETEAAAVAVHGVDMTLWVAADNASAVRLYERSGFSQVKRTDTGACRCMASGVLQFFLGHPVWIKMHKTLPPPAHLAAVKPQDQCMPAVVSMPAGHAACSSSVIPAADAQFENVPLDGPEGQPQRRQQTAATARQGREGSGLLRKLGLGMSPRHSCKSSIGGSAASTSLGQGSAAATPGVTPRIAAVGGGLPAAAPTTVRLSSAGGGRSAASVGAEGMQTVPLDAPGMPAELHGLQLAERPSGKIAGGAPAMHLVAADLFVKTAGLAPSMASTSVASFALESDSDEEHEQGQLPDGAGLNRGGRAAHAHGMHGLAEHAPGPYAFELVELSSTIVAAVTVVPA